MNKNKLKNSITSIYILSVILSCSIVSLYAADPATSEAKEKKAAGCDQDPKVESCPMPKVAFLEPKVRAAKKTQNSAAFVTIENRSDKDVEVVKAESPAAEIVELHEGFQEDGVQKMRAIEKVTIKANDKAELKPGGLHIMLMKLKDDLSVDEQKPQEVPITLTIKSGKSEQSVKTTFYVSKIETPAQKK